MATRLRLRRRLGPVDSRRLRGLVLGVTDVSLSRRSESSSPMVLRGGIWGLTRMESCRSIEPGAMGTLGMAPPSSSKASAERSLSLERGKSGDSLTMEGWPRSIVAVEIRLLSRMDGRPDCGESIDSP